MNESLVTIVNACIRGFAELTAETLARRRHRVSAEMREPRGRSAPAATRIRTPASDDGLLLESFGIGHLAHILIEEVAA